MNLKRLIISIAVVGVLALGGFWAYNQFLAPDSGTDAEATNTPEDAVDIIGSDVVTAEGRIVPREFVNLPIAGSGQIEELLVSTGESVSAGDPLLRLNSADQENGVAQAEAALQQAQANLSSAEAALQVAETNLSAATLGVAVAEANYDLLAAPPTVAQLALSEAAVAAAEAGVTAASGNQALVLEGATAAQVSAAEARLAAAQAQFNAAQRSFLPVLQNEDSDEIDRELAQYQLSAAQANLDSAQAALDDLAGGASNAQRIAASSAVSSAGSDVDAAEANVDLLQAGTREERLAVAQTDIIQAQNRVMEAELEVVAAETAVTQANAAITEAELAVELAQEALADRTLRASIGGIVADIRIDAGEFVNAGIPVVTIADFSAWQVETTDLTELNVVALEPNDSATISIDAFAGEELTGQVLSIAPTANEVLGDVTYVVTLELAETELPLRWGMTVFATFDS